MNTSETLHKAADLIEERGWTAGTWGEGDSPLCLEGAIAAAAGVQSRALVGMSCPAYAAVRDYLDVRHLFIWNDRLKYTEGLTAFVGGSSKAAEEYAKARVTEVLRAAAAVEELREAEARGPLNTGPTVRVPTQPGVGVA